MSSVYLCHKCGGLLTESDDKRLYSCGCMSGYVRDWQKPSADPHAEQLEACKRRIAHFEGQGRDEHFMAPYRADLARLLGTVEEPKALVTMAEIMAWNKQGGRIE